jgi:hypothetical protein
VRVTPKGPVNQESRDGGDDGARAKGRAVSGTQKHLTGFVEAQAPAPAIIMEIHRGCTTRSRRFERLIRILRGQGSLMCRNVKHQKVGLSFTNRLHKRGNISSR